MAWIVATLVAAVTANAAPAAPDRVSADAAVRAFMAREGIPAAHVTVLRGDAVILSQGYGSTALVAGEASAPTPTSIFPLGSISKQFTAAAILSLADAGLLGLEDRVGKHLPEWFGQDDQLRIHHLLSQTSGVADFLWLEGYRPLADDATSPIASYVALGAAAPRRFAPGARWSYSNTNYKALALIAERVTDQPFDRLLAERVLRPMGVPAIVPCHDLQPAHYVPGVSSEGKPVPLDASRAAYTGDGGLCGSADSLVRWIRSGYVAEDGQAPTLSRLLQPSRVAGGERVPYGYGISLREFLGRAVVWHGGNVDGHSSLVAYLPDQDLSIVILTSRGYLWPTELLPALIGAEPPARAADAGAPPAGRYEDGLFQFVITPEAERLNVEIDLIGPMTFVPAGHGEYVAERFPATFRLRMPMDGTRDRFEFDWGEVRSYALRVPEG